MGSVYRRSLVYCRTCKSRLSTKATQAACRSAGHDVQLRQSRIWTIQYQDATGRNQTESSKTSDRKKAVRVLRLREGAVARRERIVVADVTFDDAVGLVTTDYQVNERKSLTDVLGRIRHLTAFFGGTTLFQITTATIKAYIEQRRSQERIVRRERTILHADGTVTIVPEVRRRPSNAQINRETTVLGRMFSLARQDDRIVIRPHIPKLKEPAQPRKGFFEYGDFVKVRDQLDRALRHLAEFEYVTGWRIDTEVLPLRWRQVDVAAGEVRIDDPRSTKNEQARVFPFTEDLRRTLEAQRQLTEGLDSPYVFCPLTGVRKGQRLSYSGFYKAWKRAVHAAGVARVPHDFRRTAIRNLERDGVPRSVAMAMVGQKTEEVYRRYAIVDEAMIREAAVKMNRGARTRRASVHRTDVSASAGRHASPSAGPTDRRRDPESHGGQPPA
jgi:integrase